MFEENEKGDKLTFLVAVGDIKSKQNFFIKEVTKREKNVAEEIKTPMDVLKGNSSQFLINHGKDGMSIIAGYPWFWRVGT